jgi:hypothetical protein
MIATALSIHFFAASKANFSASPLLQRRYLILRFEMPWKLSYLYETQACTHFGQG